MSQQSQSPDVRETKVFDLHISGLGYLSRVRYVPSQPGKGRAKAKPFLACSISAFHGESDAIVYLPMDTKVVGQKAKEVIDSLADAANDRHTKVLIGFKVGDSYIDIFTRTRGDRAGEPDGVLKGRLLQVRWAKVNGKVVYREERPMPEAQIPASESAEREARRDEDPAENEAYQAEFSDQPDTGAENEAVISTEMVSTDSVQYDTQAA